MTYNDIDKVSHELNQEENTRVNQEENVDVNQEGNAEDIPLIFTSVRIGEFSRIHSIGKLRKF